MNRPFQPAILARKRAFFFVVAFTAFGCGSVQRSPHSDLLIFDSDGDQIHNAEDGCPHVKGIRSADPKENGCPSAMVLDPVDACPGALGVADADRVKNGCPVDSDGDTIPDDKDACPHEKGKRNPDPRQNGCPPPLRVTETEFIVLQQVQFDSGTGTFTNFDEVINEVASLLTDHPEVTKVEVQGHTDDRESLPANRKTLSEARANAVMMALITRGIAPERLTIKGYGSERPIADSKTDEGRKANRRVQFVILEKRPRS